MATTILDANVWYALSETRVDNGTKPLGSTLQNVDAGMRVFGLVSQSWQLQPVPGAADTYLLRTNTQGPLQQLTACYNPDEIHPSKTRTCLKRSISDDSQKWVITLWGNGLTFKISNVANSTKYVMDVHPGSDVFMSSEVEGDTTEAPQVAQHWVFSSRSKVNDGAYSTIYSDTATAGPTATTSSTSTSSTAKTTPGGSTASPAGTGSPAAQESGQGSAAAAASSGISSGAAAGIGVGVTIAVVGLVGLLFFLWRRRRKSRGNALASPPVELPGIGPHKGAAGTNSSYTAYSGANSTAYSPNTATTSETWMSPSKGSEYTFPARSPNSYPGVPVPPSEQQQSYYGMSQQTPVEMAGNDRPAELYTPYDQSQPPHQQHQQQQQQGHAGYWGRKG